MTIPEYKLPLPQPNVEDKVFWDAAKRHKLLVQKCKSCGTVRSYAGRPMCGVCHSMDSEPVEASGKGELWSYTTTHHPFGPAWQAAVPYTVGLVKLAEGPRLVTNIVDARHEEIRIGMPVEVVFDDVTPEVTLPKFRPDR